MNFKAPLGVTQFQSRDGTKYFPNPDGTFTITDPPDIADAIAAGYSISSGSGSAQGAQTVTVGASGDYTTIQAAVDALASKTFFAPYVDSLDTLPNAITAWTINTSQFTPAFAAGTWVGFVPKTWFQVSGERMYPRQDGIRNTLGYSAHRRVDATISSSTPISWFKEQTWNIVLLDEDYVEDVTINYNASINFIGTGTTWRGAGGEQTLLTGTSFIYGTVQLSGQLLITGNQQGGFTCSFSDHVQVKIIGDVTIRGSDDDTFSAEKIASIYCEGARFQMMRVVSGSGDQMKWNNCLGDATFYNTIWEIASVNTAVAAIPRFIDVAARNLIISGFKLISYDATGKLLGARIVTGANLCETVSISGVTIDDPYSGTTKYIIAEQISNLPATPVTGGVVNITDVSINAPRKTGAHAVVNVGGAVLTTFNVRGCGTLKAADGPASATAVINSLDCSAIQSPVFSGTPIPDANIGKYYHLGVMTANITALNAPPNPQTGQEIYFRFKQDATAGRTIVWDPIFHFTAAWVNAAITTDANKVSTVSFRYDGTAWYQTSPVNVWIA
jgi:hypothetical protein